MSRAELLTRPGARIVRKARRGNRVCIPREIEEELRRKLHRLQVPDVDDPEPVRAVGMCELHLLPDALDLVRVEPFVAARAAYVIEMIVNAVAACAMSSERRQAPQIPPVIVAEEQGHIVRHSHPAVIVILDLLVERPDLRGFGRRPTRHFLDDPALVRDDALEQRDRRPLRHWLVAIAAHADRDDALVMIHALDTLAPESTQPHGITRVVPRSLAMPV